MATHIFFIFIPTWGRFPSWLIFLRWVETTNQLICFSCSIQIRCSFWAKGDFTQTILVQKDVKVVNFQSSKWLGPDPPGSTTKPMISWVGIFKRPRGKDFSDTKNSSSIHPWTLTAGSPKDHPIEKVNHLNQTSIFELLYGMSRSNGMERIKCFVRWVKQFSLKSTDEIDPFSGVVSGSSRSVKR